MSSAVVGVCIPGTRSTVLEESIMTAAYTFDVFSSLDGFGAASGGISPHSRVRRAGQVRPCSWRL